MALKAVVLRRRRDARRRDGDVGASCADAAGVPRFTLMGVLGGPRRAGRAPRRVWELLGVERPGSTVRAGRSLRRRPAVPGRLRARGLRSGRSATRPRSGRGAPGGDVDLVGSSARWGVEKPAPEFFARDRRGDRAAARRDRLRRRPRRQRRAARARAPAWSPCTSAAGRGATCTSRRPRRCGSARSSELPEALGV